MKSSRKLSTFVFVSDDYTISPILTTIPEYARWLEEYFGEYIALDLLRLPKKCKDGTTVMEYHPGTKIGQFFDANESRFNSQGLKTWKLYTDSSIMDTLVKLKLVQHKDANNNLLRLYSLQQIELFVKKKIDSNFSIMAEYMEPKKITVRKTDMNKLIKPEIRVKKSLF